MFSRLVIGIALIWASSGSALPKDYDPNEALFIMASIDLTRRDKEMSALNTDMGLLCAAQRQTLEIERMKKCTHKGKYGNTFMYRAKKCGTQLIIGSEILGCNSYFTIQALLDRKDFKDILFNRGYDKIGCDTYNKYWVCVFGK